MFNHSLHYLKLTLITGFLACISHLAYADSLPAHPHAYKIGDIGPGGGFIFFVDNDKQYPGFKYLEAAPTDAASSDVWCNDASTSIPGTAGWDANAVGRGRANTNAMLAECSSGAARDADNYTTGSTHAGDWFLPSEGEAMLMYTNLRQAGVGGFAGGFYWSSTEGVSSNIAWVQDFGVGSQSNANKGLTRRVRAVRAF
ncbi:MAG: hypothetical protein WC856_27405 [Methylococcaceae bacterium]|jgi:hypothetical protein